MGSAPEKLLESKTCVSETLFDRHVVILGPKWQCPDNREKSPPCSPVPH